MASKKISDLTAVPGIATSAMVEISQSGVSYRATLNDIITLAPATALPIASGGTGAGTAAAARTNLGLGDLATLSAPLSLGNGGTGAISDQSAAQNLNTSYIVATLAALKTLTSRPESVIVETGQAAGVWQWAAGSSTTADDGVVVQCASGAAGRYKRIYSGALDITWFGADNTGSTDTKPVLVLAEAALPAAGGTIYVPRGSYKMSSAFTSTKTGLSIEGDGWGNTIFIPASDFAAACFDLQGYAQTIRGIQINGTQGGLTITGAANNGSGLIRLAMASTASLVTGYFTMVDAVGGVPNANGSWTITVIDATHVDLQGSTFAGAYTSGGTLIRYINAYGIKTSASAANIVVEEVFFASLVRGLWTAACNDGRFNRIRAQSCAIGVYEGAGGASNYASELHFTSVVIIPYGQQGLGWVIDYNAFSNQHELITVQGSQACLTIQSGSAHNGTTILRPNGHYFGGDYNLDHAQLAAVSITSGWNIVFGPGTMTGTQVGPGLLISKASGVNNDLDGIECRGVYIGGNGTHGVQWASGTNVRMNNCRIYGNSVSSAGTYDGFNVAAAAAGSLELKGNMYGPSAASTGGWGGLSAAQRYGMFLASTSLTDVATYGSGGITLKGRLYIDEPDSVQTTALLSDSSAPTGVFKYINAGSMAASTIRGNNTVAGSPLDLTVAQVRGMLGLVYLSFIATGVNFNSGNTDTTIAISLPTGYTRYRLNSVILDGASQTLTTATCGVFTAAAAGGTALVASGTAITVSTASENANNNMQFFTILLTLTQSWAVASTPNLYFRVQTAQGAAATGNVQITVQAIP